MNQNTSMASELLSSFLLNNLDGIMVYSDYFICVDPVFSNESNYCLVSVFNIYFISLMSQFCLWNKK